MISATLMTLFHAPLATVDFLVNEYPLLVYIYVLFRVGYTIGADVGLAFSAVLGDIYDAGEGDRAIR